MKKYLLLIIAAIAVTIIVVVIVVVNLHTKIPQSNSTTYSGSYVAMGDSVAAGIGLKDYSDLSACNRTRHAYPNQVAAELNYQLKSVACSGATTTSGLTKTQVVNRLAVPSQLSTLDQTHKPSLITMTIGINDTDWTSLIKKCYVGTCGSDADLALISNRIEGAKSNISSALSNIAGLYPDHPPLVVVTGYYTLFPAAGTALCSEATGIDSHEKQSIVTLQRAVNTMLESVTKDYSFSIYTPIDFTGHELCSANPWIQGLSAAAPYHPTTEGQMAIARAVIQTVRQRGDRS